MTDRTPVTTRSEAKIWKCGETWFVHAKHPDGRWIRVTGPKDWTEGRAILEADALCAQLDEEAGRV